MQIGCGGGKQVPYDPPHPNTPATKSWDLNDFPVLINIPNQLATYETDIIAAGDKWNSALNLPAGKKAFTFNLNTGGTPNSNQQWTGVYESLCAAPFFRGIFAINNWGFGGFQCDSNGQTVPNGVLAVTTTIATSSSRIIDADVLFNFQYFSYESFECATRAGTPACALVANKIDFQSVLIHELGHYLGLNHIEDDSTSIMYPTLGTGVSKRNLNAGDVNRIRVLYNQP